MGREGRLAAETKGLVHLPSTLSSFQRVELSAGAVSDGEGSSLAVHVSPPSLVTDLRVYRPWWSGRGSETSESKTTGPEK